MPIYIYICELDQSIVISKTDHGKTWQPDKDEDKVYDYLGGHVLNSTNNVGLDVSGGYRSTYLNNLPMLLWPSRPIATHRSPSLAAQEHLTIF